MFIAGWSDERSSVARALNLSFRHNKIKHIYNNVRNTASDDVIFILTRQMHANADITFDLKMYNTSKEERTVNITVVIQCERYTGHVEVEMFTEQIDMEIPEGKGTYAHVSLCRIYC